MMSVSSEEMTHWQYRTYILNFNADSQWRIACILLPGRLVHGCTVHPAITEMEPVSMHIYFGAHYRNTYYGR